MATLQKNTRSFRMAMQAIKVGMYTVATYVASKFNSDAVETTKKTDIATLDFDAEKKVIVTHGESGRGQLARLARVDKSGKFALGSDGAFIALDVVKHDVLSVGDYVAKAIARNEVLSIKRVNKGMNSLGENEKAGTEIIGFHVGSLGDLYSSCVYALNGNVCVKDIETRKNEYNAHELVTLGDRAKVASQADTLAKALLACKGAHNVANAKGKGKTRKAAVKAKKS